MIGVLGAGLFQSLMISVTKAAPKMRFTATDEPYIPGVMGDEGGVGPGRGEPVVVVAGVVVEAGGKVQT